MNDIDGFDLEDDIELNEDGTKKEAIEQKAPVFDTAQMTSAVEAAVASQFQRQQANTTQRELTPEERAKHFAVWEPDDSFVNELNAISDPEATPTQKKKILAGMRDGIMAQAFRAAQLVTEQQIAVMREEFAPALDMAQERSAKAVLKEFKTKYPALEGQNELVESITASLNARGFKPKSRDEAFEKVATIAESILKKANPNFSIKTNVGANGKPTMVGTSMGGTGGGSGQRQQTSGKRGNLASFWQT